MFINILIMKGNSLDTFFVTASSIWILQFYKIYPLALERRATHVQMLFFQNRQTFVAEIKITCAARRLTVRSFVCRATVIQCTTLHRVIDILEIFQDYE